MKCGKVKLLFFIFCIFLCGSVSTNVSAAEVGSASERMNLNLMKTVESVQKNKVVVAVIDTGVQTDLFPNRCEQGYNAMSGAASTTDVQDTAGHGTEVASVIISNTPDNVKILPIKVGNGETVDLSGSDTDGITEDAVQCAFDYACGNADIINLCCGYDEEDAHDQTFLNTYIDKAVAKGIPVIVSAGNEAKENGSYPACYAACWTVGAIGGNNTLASFSDYGSMLDYVAPGVGINVTTNTGRTTSQSGTSFSAPYVTAFAANLMGEKSYSSVGALYEKIQSLCEDLGTAGYDTKYGHGIPVYQCTHEKTNEVVGRDATCTENGVSYRVCQYCGETTETITIEKKAHSWQKESAAPTIVSTGTSYELCTICGAVQNVTSQSRLSSATTIKVSKRSSSSLTFSWKKVTGAEGYRVVCGSKTYEITGTKMTVKKLKAGTSYKIAVQPYTIYDGQKKYGNVTSTKNVTACAKVTGIRKSKTSVKWKKISASGYEVCYSKKKNFKSAKKVLVKTTSRKMKKGYYVKVRAYRTLNGRKIYGSYSKIIKI